MNCFLAIRRFCGDSEKCFQWFTESDTIRRLQGTLPYFTLELQHKYVLEILMRGTATDCFNIGHIINGRRKWPRKLDGHSHKNAKLFEALSVCEDPSHWTRETRANIFQTFYHVSQTHLTFVISRKWNVFVPDQYSLPFILCLKLSRKIDRQRFYDRQKCN